MEFDRERKESSKKKRSFPRFQRERRISVREGRLGLLRKVQRGGGRKKKDPKAVSHGKGRTAVAHGLVDKVASVHFRIQ